MAEGLRDVLVSKDPGLSCGIIWVILRLAVFRQYRSVTDTHTHTDMQTDGRTDTRRRHVPSLAQHRVVKIHHIALHTKYNYHAMSGDW